jgi:hypothetical protein
VVRQQLLVCDDIPYTSHNRSACLIAEMPDPGLLNAAIENRHSTFLSPSPHGYPAINHPVIFNYMIFRKQCRGQAGMIGNNLQQAAYREF